jgi:hypothetical protein
MAGWVTCWIAELLDYQITKLPELPGKPNLHSGNSIIELGWLICWIAELPNYQITELPGKPNFHSNN